MAERPLLLFPSRSKVSYESKGGGPDKDLKKPSRIAQQGRVEKMFKKINKAFDDQKVIVDSSPDGFAPEMVLVFETRGTIQEFFKAVSRIPELKWLGEYEAEFPASDEFKYDDPLKPVSGKLYFFLANNDAIRELKSLWGTWKSNKQRFRTGQTKWRQLFDLLYDIRPWGIRDRVEETGILLDWQQRVLANQEVIPFEVELWYRKSAGQRKINKSRLEALVQEFRGKVLDECIINEIGYHGLLVEAPIAIFNSLNGDGTIRFFQSSDIMHLRPVGQGILKIDDSIVTETSNQAVPEVQESHKPIIALFDGVPIQNHTYLANRLAVHDPDGFEESYPANKRVHCTGMASIIIHGDLNTNNTPLKSKLLVRPVMRFHPFGENDGTEYIPENFLLVDLIHRAVREIVEGINNQPAVAPTVKVINLSLGDKYRVFDYTISPWAKLIDWLSEKYNLLFIISAGNVEDDISIDIGEQNMNDFLANPENILKGSINYLFSKNRFRKIISPGEAINALTVGAAHEDADVGFQLNNRINIFDGQDLLSPISRMGLGFRKSIKPDILAKGGRILFRSSGNGTLRMVDHHANPPGIKVAAPSAGINGFRYSKGTSNATAIVSNTAGKVYEAFMDDESLRESLTTDFFAVTSKALIVHSATWNEEAYNCICSAMPNIQNKRDLVSRFLGYGKIQPERILACTDKRVTLIGYGSLRPEEAYIYELPLPNALGGTVNWRKLTTTLAWFSPINTENQLYRTHKLWFEFPNNDIDSKLKAKRSYYDDDMVKRGTVQHEIFFSDKAQAFPDNSKLKIKVNCKTDALRYDPISFKESKNVKAIKYALVVTLEIDPQIQIDLYNEVNIRLKQPIRPAS